MQKGYTTAKNKEKKIVSVKKSKIYLITLDKERRKRSVPTCEGNTI